MADIGIPFNYDPVDNLETSASYTVPAGKYAIISATLSVSAYGNVFESGAGGAGALGNLAPSISATANSTTIELKLKAGSIVTKSETPASSSSSSNGNSTGVIYTSATSNCKLLVDGVEVSEIDCGAFAWGYDSSSSSEVNVTAQVVGTAKVHWSIAEYNSIT